MGDPWRCLLERAFDALDDAVSIVDGTGATCFENRVARKLADAAPDVPFVLVKESLIVDLPRASAGAAAVNLEHCGCKILVRRSLTQNPVWQRVTDAQRHCVSLRTPSGEIEFVNQWWRNVTGASPADGRETSSSWLQHIHPDDLPGLLAFRKGLTAASQEVRYDYRLKTRSGGYRWQLCTASPVCNDAGEIIKWMDVAIDIHELKEAQLQLAEERQLLDTIMDQLPVAVGVALPPSGRIVRNNRIGREMFPMFSTNAPPTQSVDDYSKVTVCVRVYVGAAVVAQHRHSAPSTFRVRLMELQVR